MEIDFDGLIQLMQMMSATSPGTSFHDHRRQQMILTLLKLMETKKLMETYETPYAEEESGGRSLHILMALRPHMTGERGHMTDILIKFFEIKQIIEQMEAGSYGH